MEITEDTIVYRYYGTELRMVFYLAGLFFLLLSIFSFKSPFSLSLVSFVVFLLITLLTYLDYKRHLLILDREELSLNTLFRSKLKSLSWKSIQNITTQEYGIFDLLKITRISSEKKELRVFSFMEDYYHFLKDIHNQSKNSRIDKLTNDLLTGQADF
ncbi:MAG: hypothetical protein MUP17_03100 [candidate division Zixibacteria bacterium]|nr:hypothetical protein [candidate division Zixibacteria bacterium]